VKKPPQLLHERRKFYMLASGRARRDYTLIGEDVMRARSGAHFSGAIT
jgi:hypothetical protein